MFPAPPGTIRVMIWATVFFTGVHSFEWPWRRIVGGEASLRPNILMFAGFVIPLGGKFWWRGVRTGADAGIRGRRRDRTVLCPGRT